MQRGLFLLTVMGQCVFLTCHHKEYHLIEEDKTWAEAQRYCRDKYTDLATVSDMTDMKRLSQLVTEKDAWIGLYSNQGKENRKWHWSLPGAPREALSDFKAHFEMEQPNKNITLINECMTWTQAQNYCREHYTDLLSGLDLLDLLANKSQNYVSMSNCEFKEWLWIGLFTDTWNWSDGSNSSFRHWNLSLLKDGVGEKECATVLSREGKWDSADCNETKPFVCYDDKVILINKRKTWEEAVNYCRENHLDLVSITNPHTQRWVAARAKKASGTHVWLGLRYTCFMDLWFWVSDQLLCYENWKDSDGVCGSECHHAAAMEVDGGKWVKKADTETFKFICALK
ncbi:putative C-type lectin domain family 20 member A [Tautogolabrus adspersus]